MNENWEVSLKETMEYLEQLEKEAVMLKTRITLNRIALKNVKSKEQYDEAIKFCQEHDPEEGLKYVTIWC